MKKNCQIFIINFIIVLPIHCFQPRALMRISRHGLPAISALNSTFKKTTHHRFMHDSFLTSPIKLDQSTVPNAPSDEIKLNIVGKAALGIHQGFSGATVGGLLLTAPALAAMFAAHSMTGIPLEIGPIVAGSMLIGGTFVGPVCAHQAADSVGLKSFGLAVATLAAAYALSANTSNAQEKEKINGVKI